jgi:cytochrome c peroxidase
MYFMATSLSTRTASLVAIHQITLKTTLRTAAMTMTMLIAVTGCGSNDQSASTAAASATTIVTLSAPAQLGQKIFSDASLSASNQLACATCHNPTHAHAPANALAVQLGGVSGQDQGTRAAPSLRYLNLTPAFFFASDGTPTGGFDRDGRAATLAEQAHSPFLAAHEMANASVADVVTRLSQSAYANEFKRVFGAAIMEQPDIAFARVLFALQQYQREDRDFFPFTARYDQFLVGKAALSMAELRGLALFNNPAKGNCAACHPSSFGRDGSSPLFTDFSFDNLGVPRNTRIAANADPAYFDLGLCGPDRADLAGRSDLCGAFKVPTLRNVTTRKTFFHNGRFDNLRDAIGFYVRRDTNPEQWYPLALDGSVDKFDDLPAAYKKNVNLTEVPYNRVPGMAPALSEQEIDDVISFLGTLTDGDLAGH